MSSPLAGVCAHSVYCFSKLKIPVKQSTSTITSRCSAHEWYHWMTTKTYPLPRNRQIVTSTDGRQRFVHIELHAIAMKDEFDTLRSSQL